MTRLSLAAATALIDAAIVRAESLGVAFTVTVVDAGGRTVAVNRMDGAPLVSIDGSSAKARTSVFFGGAATRDLQPAVQPGGPLFTMADASTDRLTFVGGGVPVLADGELIGAIGVGGGSADQDHEVATAAATAAK